MTPERWIILVLLVILALVWVKRDNPVDNKAIEKQIDSLQFVNHELQEKLNISYSQRDTAISIMLKSLNNVNPVKQKHEAIRKTISAAPVDSLFKTIQERSASIHPD